MRERHGRVHLNKGHASMKVVFFEAGGGAGLVVDWSGPGIGRTRLNGRYMRSRKSPTKKKKPKPRQRNGWKAQFWRGVKGVKNVQQAQHHIIRRPDSPQKTMIVHSLYYPETTGHWKGLDSRFNDAFAARFTGTVNVPRTGYYNFWTKSDDGSKLWVYGKLVVNNDGLHGMRERRGRVHLHKGHAKIKVIFFEAGGGAGLVVDWSGPGIKRESLNGPDGKYVKHRSKYHRNAQGKSAKEKSFKARHRQHKQHRKRHRKQHRKQHRKPIGWKAKFWRGVHARNVHQAEQHIKNRPDSPQEATQEAHWLESK